MEKKYVKTFFTGFLLLLSSIVVINITVDPFYLFSSPRIKGFNYYKPAADTRMRLSKAYLVKSLKPKTVIIGSSRALAINQNNPVFTHKPVINYALASSTSYELYRYLQHTNHYAPLKEIIYGLDFFNFSNGVNEQFYRDYRLATLANGTLNKNKISGFIKDAIPGLFTISALKASIRTIKNQNKGDLSSVETKPKRLKRVAEKGGHYNMFTDLEKSILINYKNSSPLSRCPTPSALQHTASRYDSFRKILRLAYSNNIQLKMFISPQHARLLEIYSLIGPWATIENWKRDITKINHEEATLAGKALYPIWDFSGYNKYTTEPVPTNPSKVMDWYWEDYHYTTELADIMLDTMFSGKQSIPPSPGFGKLLHVNNVESILLSVCHERQSFIRQNPAFANKVHSFVNNFIK